MALFQIGHLRHYNCANFRIMQFHAIILSLLLLLPLVSVTAQEQDDEAIPITFREKKPSFNGGDTS